MFTNMLIKLFFTNISNSGIFLKNSLNCDKKMTWCEILHKKESLTELAFYGLNH
jgi:hypothetical protein